MTEKAHRLTGGNTVIKRGGLHHQNVFTGHAHTKKLKIALVATTGRPVPTPGYGPCELIIDGLARGLVELGHEVMLFAASDSTCPVPKHPGLPASNPKHVNSRKGELEYILDIYEHLDGFDIIHDHTLIGPTYARAFPGHRVVTTNHGPTSIPIFPKFQDWVPVLSISESQARQAPYKVSGVIHHGIDASNIPIGKGDGNFVLFMGRMSPDKGVHVAIETARKAGLRLVIAGAPVKPSEERYFSDVIRPLLGPDIDYLGEVAGEDKFELLGQATALLNPLQWEEPFGLTMVEAMAAGTPVVSLARGAAPEVVEHGSTGFVANNENELINYLGKLDAIERTDCRARVENYFSYQRMARDHAAVFNRLLLEDPWSHSTALKQTVKRAQSWQTPVPARLPKRPTPVSEKRAVASAV